MTRTVTQGHTLRLLIIKTGHKLPKHYVMKTSVYQRSPQENISTRQK